MCVLRRLHKLTFASSLKYNDGLGPCSALPNQLVTHLSSFGSLTCLSLTGVRIAQGSADLTHASLKRLVLDGTDPAGVSIRRVLKLGYWPVPCVTLSAQAM